MVNFFHETKKKKTHTRKCVRHNAEKYVYFYCAVDVGFAERLQPDDLWVEGDGREGRKCQQAS